MACYAPSAALRGTATNLNPRVILKQRHQVSIIERQGKAMIQIEMTYYLDCEFDGHGGPLISIALIPEVGQSLYLVCKADAKDEWVQRNVIQRLAAHKPDFTVSTAMVGDCLRNYIGDVNSFKVVADSPVDIMRFCTALSTGPDGSYYSTYYESVVFEVHNVRAYPTDLEGAVQHNAYWDAMALRHALTPKGVK